VDTMIRALGRETDAATPLPDDPGAFPETAEATSRAER
jgi:hypothetical protein